MSTRREFLAGLAAGPLLAPNAASAADPPDSILSKPRLGAEFFLNNRRDPRFRGTARTRGWQSGSWRPRWQPREICPSG
jgi:hypothetical protein